MERARRDVDKADLAGPELFAECMLRCSSRVGEAPAGGGSGARPPPPGPAMLDAAALQGWVLVCCQAGAGGLRDKPGKPRDQYHTCYCLSGLSQVQHYSGLVLGPAGNALARADPAVNVVESRLSAALAHWEACEAPR